MQNEISVDRQTPGKRGHVVQQEMELRTLSRPMTSFARTQGLSRAAVETELAEIWQQSLGVQRIRIHENFFQIGGHSLTAMRVVLRIHRSFGVDVPVSVVFGNPTIASLAVVIEEMCASAHSDEEILRMLAEIEAESEERGSEEVTACEHGRLHG